MKLSKYVKIYPYNERPGYLLLYSTKQSSKILVKEETVKSILKGSLPAEHAASLSNLGMIVTDPDAEKNEMLGFLDVLNKKNETINIIAVLNLDCNFKCVYCYEGELKGAHYMTDETAGLLVDFIRDRMTPKKQTINIDFFGGEPMLSIDMIKTISGELKSFAEERGVIYTFTLITNGSLFKRRYAEELTTLGLTGIKTTIDGPPETHNITRPFKSGAGSFNNIIENLKQTWDLVTTIIGGNYTRENYHRFPLLFDYLSHEGLTPDRIHEVRFTPVIQTSGGLNSPADFSDGMMSINEPWVVHAGSLLREEILKRGYFSSKISPSPCQIDIDDYYVVNHDGGIYKCHSFIGNKAFQIGHLRKQPSDWTLSHKTCMWKNSECMDCVYLPLCFGGCQYMTYVRDGCVDKIDCRRPYLEASLETMIRQDIIYAGKPKNS
ncbi:MAG: geopeptide radical SAM maturase [Nitrospirae bacterium]|nr:geopeptide radical SAM maturase [Nitrospirota bacterium]